MRVVVTAGYTVNAQVSQTQHLSDSNKPFLCVYCLLSNQAVYIAELKSTLVQLTSKLSSDCSNLPTSPNAPTNLSDDTGAVPTKPDKPKSNIVHSEKKFNVVVYGIEESTPRQRRTQHDLQHLITSLSVIDSSIKPHAVKVNTNMHQSPVATNDNYITAHQKFETNIALDSHDNQSTILLFIVTISPFSSP